MRPFRFGYQFRDPNADELRAAARSAEAAGFDVIHSWDHVTAGWSALAPLLTAAEATTRLRICPLVINNDFHHPVHLAREISSIDHLTGGRVELGIGAGHSFTEYAAIGQRFDPPAVRKARLAESVEILRRLLDGETVDATGEHYAIGGARVQRSAQDHLPMLVAVAGRVPLAHAAVHADAIGLMGLGRDARGRATARGAVGVVATRRAGGAHPRQRACGAGRARAQRARATRRRHG